MAPQFSVFGDGLRAQYDAFKGVPDAPRTVFLKHGLITVAPNGEVTFPAYAPLDKLLAATNELIALGGARIAFEMGQHVPKRASVPPDLKDPVVAMKLMDDIYHMHHQRDGEPMFDPQTGKKLEGIGHYAFVSGSRRRIVMEVDSPYNCDLDRGILQGFARILDSSAICTHLEPSVCRKNRAARCRYELSFR